MPGHSSSDITAGDAVSSTPVLGGGWRLQGSRNGLSWGVKWGFGHFGIMESHNLSP